MTDFKVHRRKFVTIRVTGEEKKQIEDLAKQSGKDVSTYGRECMLKTDLSDK
jgi:predicted DNA-binding protein